MAERSKLDLVFAPFDLAARAWDGAWSGIRDFLRDTILLKVIFALILVITGIYDVLARVLSFVDKAVDKVETTLIFVFTLLMTGLVFLDFLDRELASIDLGLQGALKLSLILMIWVAFLGASLATKDDRHLTIDAADRALSPAGSARLYRISMGIAAVFCWKLATASVTMIKKAFDLESLAKLTVPESIGVKLNAWTAAILEGRLDPEDYQYFLEEGGFAVALGQNVLKLWVAELIFPIAFFLMAARFAARFFGGKPDVVDVEGIAMPAQRTFLPNASTRDILLAGLIPGLLLGMLGGLWFGQGTFILICAILLVLAGAPLFVVIGIAAALCVALLEGRDLGFVVKEMYKATDKEALLAIPFFVMAGALMTEGSIARRLIEMARAALGWIPGGLAVAGVVACMIFAAISGSSPVTVIAIGSIMVPALVNAGYDEEFSLGLLTSAGSLGILIPPSIPMIIFAVVAFADPSITYSASDLFIAGVGPGLLIGGILIGWSIFKERDKILTREETLGQLPRAMIDGIWAAGLPILILWGIYSGTFTATEAAAVSVVYALVVEFVIHPITRLVERKVEGPAPAPAPDSMPREDRPPVFDLTPMDLPRVFRDSAVIMGSLLLIVVLAIAFNQFLVFQEVPAKAAAWVQAHVDSKVQFLILVNIFLLILGCMMDIMSAILIVGPLLTPIALAYGVHPVHFGIIFIVNLEIGYLTPPLGLNLFVASSVFNQPILKVIKSVIPFTLLMLIALAIITGFEPLSTALLTEDPAP
ncbi:MAG: TRAP transporter large permease subunit [Deltaproteobacteria bacterium]|nr:TRAP transporter large permease subunit [Deltaproteobacteria bacterium]